MLRMVAVVAYFNIDYQSNIYERQVLTKIVKY
jgi:hypothetical protein